MGTSGRDRGARVLSELEQRLGPQNVLVDADMRAGSERDWTRRWGGPSIAVVRPGTTPEVAEVVSACTAEGIPLVAQGGNTGLVGGSVPWTQSPGSPPAPVIVSTVRLDKLDPVDEVEEQVTCQAGVTLSRLQGHARDADLDFPVDLAARDSATLGGMVATNAGGLQVLRFGTMRSQVTGIEAVMADGSVISPMRGLSKDNTGYDLAQLMIGSEGTLGIVTAVRVRLVPPREHRVTALIGLTDVAAAIRAFHQIRRRSANLESAELVSRDGVELVCAHASLADPLPDPWRQYLLVECAGIHDPTDELAESLAASGVPENATALATDGSGRRRLWEYRERQTEAISSLGVPHKLDVTLPLGRLAEFCEVAGPAVETAAPGSCLFMFGHLGDGNMHVNIVGPDAGDETVDGAILRLIACLGGSISAEHGIGRAKAKWLGLTRSAPEIQVMRSIKGALDARNILNPGAILTGDGF